MENKTISTYHPFHQFIETLFKTADLSLRNHLQELLPHFNHQSLPLITYLITHSKLDTYQLALACSEALGLPFLDLDTVDTSEIKMGVIAETLLNQYSILPLWEREKIFYIAIADPSQYQVVEAIQFQIKQAVYPLIVEQPKLEALRQQCLNHPQLPLHTLINTDSNQKEFTEDTDHPPLIHYVNRLIQTAFHQGASDIHFEPYQDELKIRFRIDGVLYYQASPPGEFKHRILSRLKIMAQLDITEHRLPQDGRFQFSVSENNEPIDCRMNTCPTLEGEKIVLRLLNRSKMTLNVDSLGFHPKQKKIFLTTLQRKQGMILVTGPTGSGKTVTLYSALNQLNQEMHNISTVEDPVEIHLAGINQVNVYPKIGLDFPTVLRALLRQDPDIIMIGEMRDFETASVGIQAAQTGHLVLSTLHTNSASETLIRLLNLGIAAYNLASSVNLVIAQRLARKLCSHCKTKETLSISVLNQLGFEIDTELNTFAAVGCQRCTHGYQGRVGIFELLPFTPSIQKEIVNHQSVSHIETLAQKEGMMTLKASAFEKLKQGLISVEEMMRLLQST